MGKFDGAIALVRGLLPKAAGQGAASKVAGQGAASKVASGAAKGTGLGGLGYGLYKGAKLLGGALSGAGEGPPGSQSASNDNKALTSKFGMVGAAGRQTSGGGTMPDFSRMSSVSVSSNDSQKEILQTAVKLLSSIDASMKTQIQQQRFVQQQQVLQQRESDQEYKSVDAVIAGRVQSFRSSKIGSTLEGIFNTALLGALGFAAIEMGKADGVARDFMSTLSDTFKNLGIAAIAIGGGGAALIGGTRAARAALAARKEFVGPMRPGEAAAKIAKKTGVGALAGIGSKMIKGGLWGAAFEALGYLTGNTAITGRNIAGSLGTIVGGGLGFIGGLGLGSIPVGIAGGYAGNKIATSVYDFFAGNSSPDATQVGANGDVEKILSTIRMRESGGDYTIQSKSSSASGAYQFVDGTWRGLTKKFNVGTEYSRAYMAPPEVQDEVARRYANDILRRSGGDVSKVPLEWYTGNINGVMSAKALAANNGLTPQEYQKRWMENYNDPSSITKGGGQYGAQAMSSDMAMGMAQFQTMANKLMGGPLGPTNLMTRRAEKAPSNQGMSAENIQAQAVAMETAQRSNARVQDQKIPPALTRASIAQNVAATSAGGAMNVPNPGYEGQNNMLDYLVYFGLAA